jgi:hypothetical protein
MNFAEAKQLILKHAEGAPSETPSTLLESLRPYRGIQDRHFLEILEALVTVAPELNSGATVDREIVHALWDLCCTSRAWTRGPIEPMFHGRRFISGEEKQMLDEWIGIIESCTLRLLRGGEIPIVFMGLPWYLNKYQWGDRAAFLAPAFISLLPEYFDSESIDASDDVIELCTALATMTSAKEPILRALRGIQERATHLEIRAAVSRAIEQLTASPPG